MLRDMIARDPLPGYRLSEEPGDIIRVVPRDAVVEAGAPVLRPETLDEAREILPGQDIYAVEAAWRRYWQRSGRTQLRAPDRAFLGFVRKQKADK
jgi:hypothetical protein